jgi:hypothetical protein
VDFNTCYSANLLECYGSSEVICQIAKVAAIDAALCSKQVGCESCVATPLSGADHLNMCQWFAGAQSCGSACAVHSVGCGVWNCEQKPTTSDSSADPSSVGDFRLVLFILTSGAIATLISTVILA